jgi:hypothetical protein
MAALREGIAADAAAARRWFAERGDRSSH